MKKKDRYRYEVDLILTTRQAYEVNVPANSPAEARKIARNNTEGASLVGEPSCVKKSTEPEYDPSAEVLVFEIAGETRFAPKSEAKKE